MSYWVSLSFHTIVVKWCYLNVLHQLLISNNSVTCNRNIPILPSERDFIWLLYISLRFYLRLSYESTKLHMSLSRHLQNGVPMSPSSETCHILVTCRHVVATWQDILTHIIGGSCRVMSSPWRHVVIYQFMVIWSTLDDCFWWYNIGYAQTSLCCMYFIWNFYWITSLFSSRLTLRYSPQVENNQLNYK